jgi:hypothetical protein
MKVGVGAGVEAGVEDDGDGRIKGEPADELAAPQPAVARTNAISVVAVL